jgi:hypothetical protein
MTHHVIPNINSRYTSADFNAAPGFLRNALEELIGHYDVSAAQFEKAGRKPKLYPCWMHAFPRV